MKALLALFVGACAFAQPAESPIDVPRLLTERGIKSAKTFVDAYQEFQRSVAAIPAASTEMERAIRCARQSDAICANFESAVRQFHGAQFNLRRSHSLVNEALDGMLFEMLSLATKDMLVLSDREDAAVQLYLETTAKELEQDFAAAERRWQRTWRRTERILDRKRMG